MQNITVAGRIGQDAKLAHTQGGDAVCNFSVPADQGRGDNKRTNWFRCSIWGKRAEALSPYLLKGVPVAVSGQFETSEYEGKTQLNIRVDDVTLLGKREGGSSGPRHPNQNGWGGDTDLDDEIPPF